MKKGERKARENIFKDVKLILNSPSFLIYLVPVH